MTDTATPTASTTPSTNTQSAEPAIIEGGSGAINFQKFREASGLNKITDGEDDDTSEDESNTESEPEVSDSDTEDNEEISADGESSDKSDTEEESESTDLEEVDKSVKGKGIQLKTKDGKILKLPADATIIHKVDGVPTEINLQQAINREVGELTVEQRLARVGNVEHNLKRKLAEVESREASEGQFLDKIANLAVSEDPSLAFIEIAERANTTPGAMFRHLLNKGREWAKLIEKKGLTDKDIDLYCTQVDSKFYKKKIEDKKSEEVRSTATKHLENLAVEAVKKYNLADDEFDQATTELLENEEVFDGLSPEKRINLVVNRALGTKHNSMIQDALKGTGLENDQKVINALFRVTDPIEWTVEEIKETALASKSQSLATKLPEGKTVTGQTKKQNVGAKTKQEIIKVTRQGDVRRQFGL